jgi:ligand-binding SRPBCC domain-containing protein
MYHQLKYEQKLPAGIGKVWDYFSNPANLGKITPSTMGFKITSPKGVQVIYPGLKISYKVSPLFGIPLVWVSEITTVKKKELFVDEQVKGPYKYWQHKHYFQEIDEGTLIQDLVTYQLPFGPFGKLAHFLFVKKKLKEIFSYRKQKITEIFGEFTR